MAVVAALRREAAAAGMALSDLALAWALSNPAITSVLVGARNIGQLERNFRATQMELDPALLRRLDGITAPLAAQMGNSLDYFQGAGDSRSY